MRVNKKQKFGFKDKRMTLLQLDEAINQLNMVPVLNQQVRQVKWLYNNSNKLTKVYDEKLVRLMVARLSGRINELEQQLKNKQP